jgi:hypothetical protein
MLALAGPAAAQGFKAVEPITIKGAHSLIIVPQGWTPETGGLFVYAHGYTLDQRTIVPYPADITPGNLTTKLTGGDQVLRIPLILGYAVATTTFRSVGWAVEDAVKDIESLRRYFVKKYGEPAVSYIWGHSEGGMVTQAVLELASKHYDGALPFCAPGAGGRRNFNAAWDLRTAYDYICDGVPGAAFVCGVCSGSRSRCVIDADCAAGETCSDLEEPSRPEQGLTRECLDFLLANPDRLSETPAPQSFVGLRAGACFGGDTPTPDQAARKDRFMRTTQLAANFVQTDLLFASAGIAEVYHKRTKRRVPWSNTGVLYAPPTLTPEEQQGLNSGVRHVGSDAKATKYMRKFFEPRAKTDVKVLTLHALDDGLVLAANQEKYRAAFEAAGKLDQLVQLYTPTGGHCGFSGAEHVAVFLALTAWVEQGTVPTALAVNATCQQAEALAGGPCRIQDATPEQWGSRVVERRQAGVKVKSLVCDGDAVDCPAGSTCNFAKHRCE